MDNYSAPDITELVWNESFRKWVLEPTPELDAYWNEYLHYSPQIAPVLAQAREIVLALQVGHSAISEQEIRQIARGTIRTIEAEASLGTVAAEQPPPWYQRWWLGATAACLILVGMGWAMITGYTPSRNLSSYGHLVSTAPRKLVEKANHTGKPLQLPLPDGSRVTLQKDSRISYAPEFAGKLREVYLSGEGFFEVVKDPSRPFVVYANELVTKVLGTSFTVKAYEDDEQVSVEVKTGKVSVALGSDSTIKQKATHRELEGVVLTPNQKMVFSRMDIRMTKLLVEQPVVTVPAPATGTLTFEDTPATDVFAALERTYSVDIVYDEDLFRHCPLTAAFTDESLFEKLNTICKAIEAKYEVIDGQIVVHGKGCNN